MMKDFEIQETVLKQLAEIAPEADLTRLDPGLRFRDQFTFDSVDFLSFATALSETFHLAIPEIDYPRLATLAGCMAYLQARLGP